MSDPKKKSPAEEAPAGADRRTFLGSALAGGLGMMLGGASESEAQGGACTGARQRLLGPEEAQSKAQFLFGRSPSAQILDAKLKGDGYTPFFEGAFGTCPADAPSPQPIVVIPYAKLTGDPPSTDAGIVILPPAYAVDSADLPASGLVVRYASGPSFAASELGLLEVVGDVVRETTVSADEVRNTRTDVLTQQLFGKDPILTIDRTLNSVATFGALDLAAMEEPGQKPEDTIQDVLSDATFWTKSVDLLVISDLSNPPLAFSCCSCCCSCCWTHDLEIE